MEANEDDQPSLPPNYVSLADLQQRWLKQQEQKNRRNKHKQKEKEKEKEEETQHRPNLPDTDAIGGPNQQENKTDKQNCFVTGVALRNVNAKPQFRKSNPNFHNRRPFRRDYGDRKGPQEYCWVKSVPELKQSTIEGNGGPKIDRGNQTVVDHANGDQMTNVERKGPKEYRPVKNVLEPKPSKVEGVVATPPEINGGDQTMDDEVNGERKDKAARKIKKKFNQRNKRKVQNPATEEQKPAPEKEKPASNGECGEVRGGCEAPTKVAVYNRTVKVEEKVKKLSAKGSVCKNRRKWTKPGRNGESVEVRDNEAPLKLASSDEQMEVEDKLKKHSANGEESTNEVKGDSVETPLKLASSDEKVEVEDKLKKHSANGEESKNEVKGGSVETPLKSAMNAQKGEVEERLSKLYVNGRSWRSDRRPRAVIEGGNWMYRRYDGGGYRGTRNVRTEYGKVWVKKGEAHEV